jgi:hypothetical protein
MDYRHMADFVGKWPGRASQIRLKDFLACWR